MKPEWNEDAETAVDGAQVASATDCTGLVPALSGGEGQERLAALRDVIPPKRGKKRRGNP